MSENEEAMSMLDNIEEHCEAQHHEIERLTRERDEAREWLTEARDNAQRLLEAADGWKLAAKEAQAEVERLREDAERYRWLRRVHENWDVLMRESEDACWQDVWGDRLDAEIDKARGKT